MKLIATVIVIIVGIDSALGTGYLPPNHIICKPEEVLEGRTDCQQIKGNITIEEQSFSDDVQERFHSVRLIRGRINIINVPNMTILHAFMNVWDIEVIDPIYMEDGTDLDPGFTVSGCLKLKEIKLEKLVSFISTYDRGFNIKGNGDFKMNKKQWNFLRNRVGSRNMMVDIDREPNKIHTKDNSMAANISTGIAIVLGLVTLVIVGSLVHFYTLTNKSTEQMEYFENLLNGTGEDSMDNGYPRIRRRARKNTERDSSSEE